MQVAVIFDAGRAGLDFITELNKKLPKPIKFDSDAGEILWKVDDATGLVKTLMSRMDDADVVQIFFVGTDDADMTQFLSI